MHICQPTLPIGAPYLSADQESPQQLNGCHERDLLQLDQLNRWASLIAGGGIPFPPNLTPRTANILAERVQNLRREQLIRFIASQIAHAIIAKQAQHNNRETINRAKKHIRKKCPS